MSPGPIRILIVDDDSRVGTSLARLLRAANYHVDVAAEPDGALALVAAAPPDVAIVDIRMPGIGGTALLRRMRDDHPRVARVMMSAFAQLDEVIDAAPLSHQALSKPCSAAELRATIARARVLRDLLIDETLRSLVGGLATLPSPRGGYQRLQNLSRRASTTVRDVARVVETDPALAAQILHLANSAFFAPPMRVTAVERAVTHLGLDLVRALALSSQVFAAVGSAAGRDTVRRVEALQRHAILATQIGRPIVGLRPELAEDAWAALLLHDIGELVLAVVAPSRYEAARQRARDRNVSPTVTEREEFGHCHAIVGACLMQLWGIPAEVVEAIARHPDLTNGDSDELDLAAIVHVAAALADERDGLVAPIDLAGLGRRGVAAELVEAWREAASRL